MYATTNDVQARLNRELSDSEKDLCTVLLEDSAVIIDSYNKEAKDDAKLIVSCRMVIRAMQTTTDIPIGATQGTTSALGYSQTWTLGTGSSTGELYLSKLDKKLLGSSRIGSYSPLENLT